MAQEQSRAQAQHKQVKNKHFWTFRAAAGDNAAPELILYGDIASETWWGDEVTPRQFTEELDALGRSPKSLSESTAAAETCSPRMRFTPA